MKIKQMFEELFDEFSSQSLLPIGSGAAQLAAEQAALLAPLAGQPGFHEAVRAARDNVMLEAAIGISEAETAARQRLLGILQGALTFAVAV